MIETLEDWNAALMQCGCCRMPECPVPSARIVECGIAISGDFAGLVPAIFLSCYKWGSYVRHCVETSSYDGVQWGERIIKSRTIDATRTDTASRTDDGTCITTTEYSGTFVSSFLRYWSDQPINKREQVDVSLAWSGASSWATGTRRYRSWDIGGNLLLDQTTSDGAGFPSIGYGELEAADGEHVRLSGTSTEQGTGGPWDTTLTTWHREWSAPMGFSIRWTVPEDHTGSWFLIVWDEKFEPQDEEGEVVLTERSVEWTGGDKVLPWQDPATRPDNAIGCLEPANVRFQCYRSPAGGKPQLHDGFPTHIP